MASTADYDAPRVRSDDVDQSQQFLTEFTTRRGERVASVEAEDGSESVLRPVFELDPLVGFGQDLQVVPRQADESTCTRCFLIVHRSRTVQTPAGTPVCRDCSGR